MAPNGAVAEFLLLKQHFDIGVLDLGLPMVDGLTVLKRVRAAKPALPMLVLTALDGSGAPRRRARTPAPTTHLTKPFDFPELEARIRALLVPLARYRRRRGAAVRQPRFDRDARRATSIGAPIELSPREWMLLDLLLTQRDRVVTKDQIAESWAVERSAESAAADRSRSTSTACAASSKAPAWRSAPCAASATCWQARPKAG